ncbi:hypothetical protein [Niallia sp. FSL W8-1348]|uniref:hypothetical protein n=1 Tax=Niallia sp. FSL W8-1348 TaxID=2954656 RepID=UPI0030FB228E
MSEKLNAGIYAIINKKLRIVYVGQTQLAFVVRWIEHVLNIPEYTSKPNRMNLYLDKDTHYIVLKMLDPSTHSKKDFLIYEHQAMDFYKSKDWIVVSHDTYTNKADDTVSERDFLEVKSRYKRCIRKMVNELSDSNKKYSRQFLYNGLYKKINKESILTFTKEKVK